MVRPTARYKYAPNPPSKQTFCFPHHLPFLLFSRDLHTTWHFNSLSNTVQIKLMERSSHPVFSFGLCCFPCRIVQTSLPRLKFEENGCSSITIFRRIQLLLHSRCLQTETVQTNVICQGQGKKSHEGTGNPYYNVGRAAEAF